MKAIYEVTFYRKDGAKRDAVSDSRRKAGEASTRGVRQVLSWAESVCDESEWVGSIQLVATERP
jgi:hypothetical protein